MLRKMGLCFYCVHLGDTNDDDEMTCAAYPDGIPESIVYGERDHRNPLPGDNGIRFAPGPGEDLNHLETVVYPRLG